MRRAKKARRDYTHETLTGLRRMLRTVTTTPDYDLSRKMRELLKEYSK
jgi:hypothetical protein